MFAATQAFLQLPPPIIQKPAPRIIPACCCTEINAFPGLNCDDSGLCPLKKRVAQQRHATPCRVAPPSVNHRRAEFHAGEIPRWIVLVFSVSFKNRKHITLTVNKKRRPLVGLLLKRQDRKLKVFPLGTDQSWTASRSLLKKLTTFSDEVQTAHNHKKAHHVLFWTMI